MDGPHPQFTAFLNEILQDDEIKAAFDAAQAELDDEESATEWDGNSWEPITVTEWDEESA